MPVSREPWIKVKIGYARSDKLAALAGPSLEGDSARLGHLYLLLAAKTQRRMGVFVSRAHVVEVLGRRADFYEQYLAEGLIHVAPVLCDECARRHVDDQLESGNVVIHDYLVEQRDPTNAERQAAWREKQRAERDAHVTAEVTRHSVTDATGSIAGAPVAEAPVTAGGVTREPAEHAAGRPNGHVTPDSRTRGTTATATRTVTRRKKDVIDEELNGAAERARPRAPVDDLDLSDPNRAGRPSASSEPRPLTVPPAIAAATPGWRTPCTNYVAHQLQHKIIDGMAVCPPCEDAQAAGGNGAARDETVGLWGGGQVQ